MWVPEEIIPNLIFSQFHLEDFRKLLLSIFFKLQWLMQELLLLT